MKQIGVRDLKARLDEGNDLILLDVREAEEREICTLPGDIHIPMREIPARTAELSKEKDLIVYCRSGGRSAQIVHFLHQNGYSNAVNLSGGILAWAREIDPDMPSY